jgi:hypothetical protein
MNRNHKDAYFFPIFISQFLPAINIIILNKQNESIKKSGNHACCSNSICQFLHRKKATWLQVSAWQWDRAMNLAISVSALNFSTISQAPYGLKVRLLISSPKKQTGSRMYSRNKHQRGI